LAWFFVFFFISGCCSIIYEIVWLRLAMAHFGVTTALTSILLSAFMAGLGLGSWVTGRLIPKYESRISFPPLRLYALTELFIGLSAVLVPIELKWGQKLLEHVSLHSSFSYYLACGMWIGLAFIPWCTLMGATIPLAMFAIRGSLQHESSRSFSFLYLANVLGAVAGTIVPLVLVELFGFRGTLSCAAAMNFLLAASATTLSLRREAGRPEARKPDEFPSPVSAPEARSGILLLLLATGLTSMAIEVVWIRQFTPFLGTVVYAFALILGSYLTATFAGSQLYRLWNSRHAADGRWIWVLLGCSILLPLITADLKMRLGPVPLGDWLSRLTHIELVQSSLRHGNTLPNILRLVIGICPFSAILGFVTPMLVDRWSAGDPERAGKAYAVNVVGCILGPLLSGFVLLPWMNERWVLFVFALPWLCIGLLPSWFQANDVVRARPGWTRAVPYVLAVSALFLVITSKGYEDRFVPRVVLRDNTATIVASGEGMHKRLRVNGVGITALDPITKVMAHLTLASLDRTPSNALVVCFGMGTTYRSLLSWQIPATAVELVPSVPRVFWYYHSDAPQLLASPRSHVVIDDGRRYLDRTSERYDVINLDPPPPVGAAASSLLYSREFYIAAKRRLQPDGILEQWLPEDETMGDPVVPASVAKALQDSFHNIRVFRSASSTSRLSLTKTRGLLFLASDFPIPVRSAAALAERMPASAVRDLLEWGPADSAEQELAAILGNEVPIETLTASAPEATALDDDRPVNEYYILRELRTSETWQHIARIFRTPSPASSNLMGPD
jgi:predicted membrane-bound spermidine synthase